MPLSNAQFDAVMRRIEARRDLALAESEARRAELMEDPGYAALETELIALRVAAAKARVSDPAADSGKIQARIAELAAKKAARLAESGYPEDYADPQFHCPICHDRGIFENAPCSCFRREAVRYLYEHAGLSKRLEEENFGTFSFEYYSDKIRSELTGKTARETAQEAYDAAQQFIGHLGEADNNLFLYGNTGVGKTFLSNCIARELLDRSETVLYCSAQDLFDLLADATFGSQGDDFADSVFSCDCLIIDDLGTELTNAFVASKLFHIINERFLRERSTVISTNLSLEEFRERYTERVFSRISGHYRMVKLIGDDIRLHAGRDN